MKKTTARQTNINLLRKHDQSMFDTVFSWALSVGRLLIIITQFVALGAFLFRFVLDRQIIDLNDTIRDKQAVVKYMENDEKKYLSLQARLAAITKYQDDATKQEALLKGIVETARGKMEFLSLNASTQGVSIEGTTTSVNLLQRLISEYKAYPGVKGVSINTIESQAVDNKIKASFSLSFTDTPQAEVGAVLE